MLISLIEYSQRNGKSESWTRRKAIKGDFKTAQKIGRNWVIDADEPFPDDARVTTGKYKDWRKPKQKEQA